jgi:hypothetical protein
MLQLLARHPSTMASLEQGCCIHLAPSFRRCNTIKSARPATISSLWLQPRQCRHRNPPELVLI